MIYGYARVSTDRQDNSLEAQQERITAYCRDNGLELTELFVDRDQSAYKIPLPRRREGKRLCDALSQGDTVIFTRIDRCFRSLQDQCSTLAKWDEMGLTYTCLDLPIQLQTPYGRLTLNVLGATSQLSSELTGMRVREVTEYLRSQGRPYGGGRPLGWLRVDGEYVESPEERALGDEALRMRGEGYSYEAICFSFAKRGEQKPQTRRGSRGYYGLADVWKLVQAASAGYPAIPPGSSQACWPGGLPRGAGSGAGQPAPEA